MSNLYHPITIVGGGLAGLMLAYVLGQQSDHRIALIEPKPIQEPSFDPRAIALAFYSQQYLAQWQLWPLLRDHCYAINDIQVSDKGHFGKTYLHAQDQNVDALGYVVTANELLSILKQACLANPQLTFYSPDSLKSWSTTATGYALTLTSGTTLTTSLLCVADGKHSATREQLGVSIQEYDYQQQAITCVLDYEPTQPNMAYERFTQAGPVAILPLSEQKASLVWCASSKQQNHILSWSNQEFIHQLQQHFGYRAGLFTGTTSRFNFPLSSHIADNLTAYRALFIGNAAHNLHPVAGQGFNLVLRDIAHCVQLIKSAKLTDDLNPLLAEYQKRSQDIHLTSWATKQLINTFSQPNIALTRTLGLLALNIQPLKSLLTRFAMGKR